MRKQYLRSLVTLLLVVLLLAQPVLAAGQDVVLAYKVHCDIGFIDSVENVIKMWRTTFIDNMLSAIDGTAEAPEGEQYINMLPGYPMRKITEDWAGQSEARKARIDEAVRTGRIAVHALTDTPMLEALDLEDAVRLLSDSSEVCREYGLELPISVKLTDVPSQSWLLPTLLSHAGVKFVHMGCNDASTQPDMPPLFWWEGVDGSRVLVMSAYGYANKTPWPAGWQYPVWLDFDVRNESAQPPTADQVRQDVAAVKNAGHTPVIGTMDDFAEKILAAIEADPDGLNIPTLTGDMPDTWIHGIASSPTETKMNRNLRVKNTELAALNTLLSLWGVDTPDPESAVDSAFENAMLFNEHNWGDKEAGVEDYGADFTNGMKSGKYERLMSTWKEHDGFAQAMDAAVTPALAQNAELLAQAVKADGARIVVFNGLAWERDGLVTAEVSGSVPSYLKNAETGEIVPVAASGSQITFAAHGVPAMGYATYLYCDEAPAAAELTVDEAANVVENDFYRVTFDPASGSISSILDKKDGNRELVSGDSEYGFGQYFNERFSVAELDRYNYSYNTIQGGWAWDDMSKTGIRDSYSEYPYVKDVPSDLELSYERTETSVTAVMTAGPSHPEPDARGVAGNTYDGMSIRVTLYADQPYIDIAWSMDNKQADPWPMADWLSLPFAIQGDPQYRLYRLGGVMDPETQIINRSGVNNLCLDGGMAILGEDGKGVALCSPDVPNVSIGKTGIYEFDKVQEVVYDQGNAFDPAEPTVFLNLYNNQWDCGWSTWNGGDWSSSVRVWSVSESYDETRDLVEPSRETRLPMTAAYADNTDGTLEASQSGLQVSAPGVHVVSFGPNADGDGTILRLWEQGGRDVDCTVTLPEELNATTVQPVDLRGTAVGDPIEIVDNQFTVAIGHNAPYSVLIDYERPESEKFISPVTDLTVTRLATGAQLRWKCDSSNAGFEVEQKLAGGSWQPAAKTGDTSVNVELDFGRYQFRVRSYVDGNKTEWVYSDTIALDSIIDNVDVRASSNHGGQGPEHVTDRSGLSARSVGAAHSNLSQGTDMWLTADSDAETDPDQPVWIEFDLGGTYPLGKTYIWNYNQFNDGFMDPENPGQSTLQNAGFKYVKILYTEDGMEWKQFTNGQCTGDEGREGLFKFAKGTGDAAMPATNLADGAGVLDFGGLCAKAIRFEVSKEVGVGNWGWYVPDGMPSGPRNDFGLSEVMFTIEGENSASLSTLKELSVDGVDLAPAFDSETYTYDAAVGAGKTELTVRAMADNPDAVISVNGQALENGQITLPTDRLNSINVQCVSPDQKNTTSYSIRLQYGRIIAPVTVETANVGGNPEWSGVPDVNVVNGSGFTIDGDDLENATHVAADGGSNMYMWGCKPASYRDGWIQFNFDGVYPLEEMWIWNFNQYNPNFENRLANRGMKNVIIEYTEDGQNWTQLQTEQGTMNDGKNEAGEVVNEVGCWYTLEKGTGQTMTATNLAEGKGPVNFGGVNASSVRIKPAGGINIGNYGGHDNQELYFGLSEVRFTSVVPKTYAISGVVRAGEVQASVDGVTVKLYDKQDTARINPFAVATTQADGSYAFEGEFSAGDYVVCVEPAPGQYGPSSSAVTVNDSAVTDADITLVPMALESIRVKSQPKTAYKVGETFDPTGLVLELHDSSTAVETLAYSAENAVDFTFAPALDVPLTTADTKVIITYGGCSVELPITVKAQEPGGGTSVSRYAITVTQGAGGRISPAAASVAKGSDKTFTITANEGYRIADVLVDGKSVGAVSSYTFENVTARHTIEARFEKAEEGGNASPFLDVKDSDWFAEAVQYVAEKGLMNGTSATKFSPSGDTTRGMIVTILYRQAGSPAVESDGAAWWSDARAWAMEKGVSDGTNMEAPITREQLAAMLYRYAGLQEADVSARGDLGAFADGGRVSAYAVEALQWAVAEGIVTGKTGGVIDPQAGATRAETAAMLMRFCENILK